MKGKWIIICLCICLSILLGGLAGYFVASQSLPRRSTSNNDRPAKDNTHASQPIASPQSMTIADVAKTCTQSVVNITVKSTKKGYTGGSSYANTYTSSGTGVIIREDGYIATCYHVVENADTITITMDDKTEYDAKLIGYDARFDLAVIQADIQNGVAAQLGDSDAIMAGEGVVIIGNPLGEFGSSVSSGILSAPTRELTIEETPLRLMQTDAAVNPGNSGGGMFNLQGQLIGIVNAKISASGIEGIGFAIPWNTISDKVDSIISNGNTGQKPVLGVSTKTAVCHIDGKAVNCLEITAVRSDTAAENAGLQKGDFLISADGKDLESNDDLTLIIKYHSVGDAVDFTVWRDEQLETITVTLGGNE